MWYRPSARFVRERTRLRDMNAGVQRRSRAVGGWLVGLFPVEGWWRDGEELRAVLFRIQVAVHTPTVPVSRALLPGGRRRKTEAMGYGPRERR